MKYKTMQIAKWCPHTHKAEKPINVVCNTSVNNKYVTAVNDNTTVVYISSECDIPSPYNAWIIRPTTPEYAISLSGGSAKNIRGGVFTNVGKTEAKPGETIDITTSDQIIIEHAGEYHIFTTVEPINRTFVLAACNTNIRK